MNQTWQEKYLIDQQPTLAQMKEFAEATYFEKLLAYLSEEYQPNFSIEYSKEKNVFGGWHLKAKKYGGNLGTIYLLDDYVRMMVVVSELFVEELGANISTMSESVQQTLAVSKPVMGAYYFVIDLTSDKVFSDLKYLLALRVKKLKKK